MLLSHLEKERWNVLKSLLNEVMDLPPESRRRFLDINCGTKGPLRREMDSLLEVDTDITAFLDTPVVSLTDFSMQTA